VNGPARLASRLLAAAALIAARAAAGSLCLPEEPGALCDGTAASGLDFRHFNGMSGELYFVENVGAGAALFDYDGDGDLDLYLLQGHLLGPGHPPADGPIAPSDAPSFGDRLFRNDLASGADGAPLPRFVDVTSRARLQAPGYGMGIATGDYDDDGDVDLYVTNFGPNQLLRNEGDGTFADVTDRAGVGERRWSVPALFSDFDRDGRLDLYVGNYVDFTVASHRPCPDFSGQRDGPDYCGALTFQPEGDRLFRNLGDGRFEDRTAAVGLQRAPGRTLGAVATDADGDGWADLYVVHDMSPNQLWLNLGAGRMVDEAMLAGAAVNVEGQPEAGMGVEAADLDEDGDEDLFVTHLTAQTNTLYRNVGGGMYRDDSHGSQLAAPSWRYTGFGAGALDLDNDGLQDLLVVNGAVEIIDALFRAGDPYPLHQPNQLFRNLGGGRFGPAGGGAALEPSEVSRGAAFGDVDNDGDTDVVITNNAGPARLLVNGATGGWIGARLLGGPAGRDMLGAAVTVARDDGFTAHRRARTDGSYASARDPRVLAGLAAARVRELRIAWPDGGLTRALRPPAGRYLVFRRGAAARPAPAGAGPGGARPR